eukprot:3776753-Rhodomonas_salina.1
MRETAPSERKKTTSLSSTPSGVGETKAWQHEEESARRGADEGEKQACGGGVQASLRPQSLHPSPSPPPSTPSTLAICGQKLRVRWLSCCLT